MYFVYRNGRYIDCSGMSFKVNLLYLHIISVIQILPVVELYVRKGMTCTHALVWRFGEIRVFGI